MFKYIIGEDRTKLLNGTLEGLRIGDEHYPFDKTKIEELFDELGGSQSVKAITFLDCNLSDEAALELALQLKEYPNIKTLSACDGTITDEGLRALMAVSSLDNIYVSGHKISSSIVPEILQRESHRVMLVDRNAGVNASDLQRLNQHFGLGNSEVRQESPRATSESFGANSNGLFSLDELDQDIENALTANVLQQAIDAIPHLPDSERETWKRKFDTAFGNTANSNPTVMPV
jgi:hypothetical protein